MQLFKYSFIPFFWFISFLYGALIYIRNKLFDLGWIQINSFNIPIISIGNITLGGTKFNIKIPKLKLNYDYLGNKLKNEFYILLNNNSHESVGGQLTNADLIDFKKLSKSLNYKKFFIIKNKKELNKKIKNFIKSNGPSFLEVKIKNGSMSNLMRPKPGSLKKIVKNFMINV